MLNNLYTMALAFTALSRQQFRPYFTCINSCTVKPVLFGHGIGRPFYTQYSQPTLKFLTFDVYYTRLPVFYSQNFM